MAVDQALSRGSVHHAGQIVVAEDQGLLVGAGRHDHGLCAQLEHAVALDDGDEVIREPAVCHGVGQYPDVVAGFDGLDESVPFPGRPAAIPVEARIGERSAQTGILLDEHHLDSVIGSGCLERRGHAGRAAADHHDIGPQVLLVEIAVRGLRIDRAQTGEAPDHRFPQVPAALRPVEGLVVETDREEPSHAIENASPVVVETAEDVLGLDRHALLDAAGIGDHIGLVADLHEAVGIVSGRRECPSGAVILEGSRDDLDAGCPQGAGDCVPGEPCCASCLRM